MNFLHLRSFTLDVLTNLSAWPQRLIRSILLIDNSSKMEFIEDGHEYKKYSQNEKDSIRGLWSCRRPGVNNIICFAAKFSFIYIRVHSESRLQFDAHVKLYSNDIKTFRRSIWCNNSLSNVLLNEIKWKFNMVLTRFDHKAVQFWNQSLSVQSLSVMCPQGLFVMLLQPTTFC